MAEAAVVFRRRGKRSQWRKTCGRQSLREAQVCTSRSPESENLQGGAIIAALECKSPCDNKKE